MKPLQLRPYQGSAVVKCLRQLEAQRRALFVGPTGCGKTEVIAGVVKALPAHARVLVIQHLLDLVAQNGARLAGYLPAGDVVTLAASLPKRFHITGDATRVRVVSGTTSTVLTALPYLGRFDVLVIDEAHHSASATYREIEAALFSRNPELRVFGVTATPERSDRKGLEVLFGEEPAAVVVLAEMIDAGYLVPPRVLSVPVELLRDLYEQQFDELPAADRNRFSLDVVHEAVIASWREHGEGRRTVFFCGDVEHSRGLAEAFEAAGVDAISLSYEDSAAVRTDVLRKFARGEGPQVVCNPLLLTEGFDAPPARRVYGLPVPACLIETKEEKQARQRQYRLLWLARQTEHSGRGGGPSP